MKKRSLVLAGVLSLSLTMGLAAPVLAGEADKAGAASSSTSVAASSDASAEDPDQKAAPDAKDQGTTDPAEENLLDALFGDNGMVSGILPEDVDINEVFQAAGEELGKLGKPVYQNVDKFLSDFREEDGSVDWEKLGQALEGLTGAFSEEDMSGGELDEYFASYAKLDEAMKDYIFEQNAEFMDPGDVQIFSKKIAHMDDLDQEEIKVMGDFTQDNYTIKDDQMNLCSSASIPMLLTVTRNEDGSFTVTDCKQAEDGEGYADSVKAMCEEVGITFDDYQVMMNVAQCNDIDALVKYMNEHPEIKGAEYMGEIKTADELQAISDAYMEELFGEK